MEIKKRLEDERYLLIELVFNNQTYVYLYDKDQKTSFLGLKESELDLDTFWQRHKQNNNYCLPCELMLCFKKRLALAKDYAPVGMGLDLQKMQPLLQQLKEKGYGLPVN